MNDTPFLASSTALPMCWIIACVAAAAVAARGFEPAFVDIVQWAGIAAIPAAAAILLDRFGWALHMEILLWLACGGGLMALSGAGAGPLMMLALAAIRPCVAGRVELAVNAACLAVFTGLGAQYGVLSGLPRIPDIVSLSPLLAINALAMIALAALQMSAIEQNSDRTDTKTQVALHEKEKRELSHRASATAQHLEHERDEAQRQLAEQQHRLASGEALLGLLARVTRDLRGSLDGMIGFAEELRKAPLGEHGQQYNIYAEHIRDGGQRMQATVGGIGYLCAATCRACELRPDFVDLKSVADRALQTMAPDARGRQVHLSRVGDDDVELFADHDAVRHIVLNMIASALERTPPQGQIAIWMRQLNGGGALFGVQDSGTGMSGAELLETAEFSSLPTAKTAGGLGLTVARVLVEMHAGSLSAEADPYKGSSVWVQFPGQAPPALALTHEPASQPHEQTVAETPTSMEPGGTAKDILADGEAGQDVPFPSR